MRAEDRAIEQFVETWIAEFSRAVEMFSGRAPEIHHNRTNTVSIPESESALWVRQVFVDGGSFTTWVGAQRATWEALGGSLGEGSSEALRSTYLEILNQAQQGSASVINSRAAKAIRCEQPETLDTASFEPSGFVTFDVELESAGLPALSFAVELRAAEVLDAKPSIKTPQPTAIASCEENSSSRLGSLLTLKLPVSVSLGRSQVEMKALLQAGPGSVITLDKDVSEPVELLIHGTVLARGEIVLAKGNYGFRVTHIASRHGRLEMCSSYKGAGATHLTACGQEPK